MSARNHELDLIVLRRLIWLIVALVAAWSAYFLYEL